MAENKIIFVTYLESAEQLPNLCRLAESIRTFGGRFKNAPIRSYNPDNVNIEVGEFSDKLQSFDVEMRTSPMPEDAGWLYYAGKAAAAAEAETAAEGEFDLLVWLDDDTIVLSEPSDIDLERGINLAYTKVMHNRSGSLFDEAPDDFWGLIYRKLEITDDLLFPMVTPADRQKIRAYFHAGLIVARPEKKILRKWSNDFELLYNDTNLADMCRADANKLIFLHQTALVGAVLHRVARSEMAELSDLYNYPVFFEKRYDADVSFDSIENVVTLRCVVSKDDVDDDWPLKLKGPSDKIAWLKERLFKER